jgi:hypothetical protein
MRCSADLLLQDLHLGCLRITKVHHFV